ncbi:hypothetical protein TrVE_jg275 [Triparma verrucosa]|uniref:Uncharacterized protein n=2 Tax=Triparma TaxID=722752 RepID=A0A9W7BTA5_9STRA|nr:hypothetical protein TrST_g11923 [Triparma strigata]GMI06996.1 hypothetical protein TrVE_jg275 [Triparma verrucosa]
MSTFLHLISKMPPLRRIAATTLQKCAISLDKRQFTLHTVSDPYLSFAEAFSKGDDEPTDLGALVIFSSTIAPLPQSDTPFLAASLRNPVPMIIIPPPEITIAEAIKESEENPLWDSMDLTELEEVEEGAEEICWDDIEDELKVTVWLQKTLDDECGGWKNTFG